MSFFGIFSLFLIFRFFDFLIISFSNKFIPYLGFFPYQNSISLFNPPKLLTSLANFDGIHYLLIAKNGYSQYEQAFFPFYPLLIRLTAPIFFNNFFLAGFFLSNLSFLFGLYFFNKYLKEIGLNKFLIFNFVSLILVYPTSFFFGAIYTEGLFFLFFAGSLYFFKKEKYLFASIFAFFASLTRLIGVFLVIPFTLDFISKIKLKNKFLTTFTFKIKYLIFLLSPLLGLLFYSIYLWQTTGDPFFFFTVQPTFGANRSTNFILLPQVYFRYLKIFSTAQFNFQYFIALVEFFIFSFVFFILIFDLIKNLKLKIFPNTNYQISNIDLLSLNLFSLANLTLPTLTGTFSSIPRYSLFSLSFFVFLAKIKSPFWRHLIFFFFFIFHIILLAFFSQGYFVS